MRIRRVLGAALLAGALVPAGGARAASVTVTPADTSVTVGDVVALRVEVSAVPDLKGSQLIYGFDASRLLFQGAAPGGAIQGAGSVFDQVLPDVSAPVDSVWYDVARLDGTGSGPGVIAFFTFQATATGDANVTCEFVDLRDSSNQLLLPSCAGSVIRIGGPVPAARGSWGRIKTIYR
jgi:hypothetical protein